KLIDAYCEKSGQTFNSLEEKLQYVATFMPPAFTDGTPYQRAKIIHFNTTKNKKPPLSPPKGENRRGSQ
ncbi:MAG: hypothetical protein LBR10_12155, partial [Prevotellaceae bacterium]|nr:hypothetical protein [Prevotellaceae bacterium]